MPMMITTLMMMIALTLFIRHVNFPYVNLKIKNRGCVKANVLHIYT
jgi:hypothetical protein